MKSLGMILRLRTVIICMAVANVEATFANNLQSASCAQTDVANAVNLALSGDTISIPAGNCTWSGDLTIPNNKKISLMGSGLSTTKITNGGIALGLSGARVSGLGLTNAIISADGNDFRIDHCGLAFSSWTDGIQVLSRNQNPPLIPTGLIDHNQLNNMRVLVNGTNFMLTEGPEQNYLWTSGLDLGGPSAVYIEDNVFHATNVTIANAVDGNYGGRYVFRYNNVNDGLIVEAHSSQEEGNRAIRKWEIYGNIIDNQAASIYFPFRLRGGTGVVFFNSVLGNWSNYGIALDNVRSYNGTSPGGFCNGSSPWDGNQDSTGYPCRDQIGRSADAIQWITSPASPYTQQLMPVYGWANRTATNGEVSFEVINSSSDHIKANRDFYGYEPAFNGATGTGCGTLVMRPATCTTGVGYWATNQSCSSQAGMVGANPATPISGTLYKCTATNTWTAYYTPYTYPHPLTVAGGSSQPVQLAAPKNLRLL
ncbi:MAG: hypothetical protein ACXWRE_08920 [Pseudobdellovibrionaceae bacterium]